MPDVIKKTEEFTDLLKRIGDCSQELVSISSRLSSAQTSGRGYLARMEISNLLEKYRCDDRRLEPFGYKVYSQGDEDGIIDEICRRLNITKGFFVEIGVENGLECNSLLLLHKGWEGTWIEGNNSHSCFINEKFQSILSSKLNVVFELVTIDNINKLIPMDKLRNSIDFLSIDVDGNDIYLLAALECSPKIICIEYNSKFPANLSKAQLYDPNRIWAGTDYFGASLKAITAVANKKGYSLVGTNIVGTNAFFVRNDLVFDLFCINNSEDYLYNPPRYWLIVDHYSSIGHPADFGLYVDQDIFIKNIKSNEN